MKLNYIKSCRFIPISRIQSGKFCRLIQLAGMLVILPIFTIACTCNSADNTQPEPYFPVQKEVAEEVMQARLEGKLVMDDAGYLRVYDALIIWPHGYSLKIEGKEIWIINDKGQAVARVGDMVMVGGGFVDTWVAEEKIGCALPEDAKGPCWLAGNVIKDSN